MTPERWRRVEELYHAALTRPAGDRAAFLASECAADDALRREVESLLAREASADGFLERPVAVAEVGPSIVTGGRLGVFEIQAQIGAGGMGEVYRARDTKLGREVAIKILPRAFTSDPERLARFEREARALASLNHPHIGAIYGVENAGGVPALVLELVEGDTLADRIGRGPVAMADALSIARQIAAALEAAHEKGIIHRDLKPANIKITPDGVVKVLDFGLAKATSDDGSMPHDSQPPTMTVAGTREGVILGTPAYMSPEQARGQIVDKRTDIWAFGCVLYEMLTGRATFQGDTVPDTIAAVLERQPDLSALPRATPAGIRRVLQRCLEKDSKRRLRDIGEARVEIETTADLTAVADVERESSPRSHVGSSSSRRWIWLAVPAVIVLAAGLFAWRPQKPLQTTEPLRAVPLTTLPGVERHPSFSPDGDRVVFTWDGPAHDNTDVYVQQIGSGTPLRLTTDPAPDSSPSWSPDGRWVAFLRGQPAEGRTELRLVPSLGGPERKLSDLHPRAELLRTLTVAWCPDSSCLVATDSTGEKMGDKPDALFVVSLESGEKRQLTQPGLVYLADINPDISPDGHWMVFSRNKTPVLGELHVLHLSDGLVAAGEPDPLDVDALKAVDATWMPDGKAVVFAASGSLWTVPVPGPGAPSRLPFVGDDGIMPVVAHPQRGGLSRLAYVRSYTDLNLWRIETSAAGAPASSAPAVAISSTKLDFTGEFSPDGHRVVFMSTRSGESEVWVADPDGSNAMQLTDLRLTPGYPRWSPDGNSIAFHADTGGLGHILMVPSAGGKITHLTSASSSGEAYPAFSPDGRWIYFLSSRAGGGIYRFAPSGGEAARIAGTIGQAIRLSPDGAYVYYLESFTRPSPLWRVPVSGGQAVKVLEGVYRSCYTVLDGGIYYIELAEGQGRLQYFDFATSKSRTVAANLGNVGLGMSATRDGRTILYTRNDSSVDDLMLVENFR